MSLAGWLRVGFSDLCLSVSVCLCVSHRSYVCPVVCIDHSVPSVGTVIFQPCGVFLARPWPWPGWASCRHGSLRPTVTFHLCSVRLSVSRSARVRHCRAVCAAARLPVCSRRGAIDPTHYCSARPCRAPWLLLLLLPARLRHDRRAAADSTVVTLFLPSSDANATLRYPARCAPSCYARNYRPQAGPRLRD